MKRLPTIFLLLGCMAVSGEGASGVDQMAGMQRWAEAKFLGRTESFIQEPNLVLKLKASAFLRKTIDGHAFLINTQTFTDGVAMRTPGEVEVHVPIGVRSFSAILGTDSNDVGYYSNAGRGSVIATLRADGRELYRSPLLREGMAGIPVTVELALALRSE
jgi:hypothetical protein